MSFFTSLHTQLGIMTWPLTLMSLITMMIVLERSLFILCNSHVSTRQFINGLYKTPNINDSDLERISSNLISSKKTFDQGAVMLLKHRRFEKSLREESVSLWLQKKRQSYTSGLRILTIIGVISPLIGLLGTVLGLIEMFKSLASTSGSVEPAQLADGLGLAMSTTAAGLLIALPAITSAQLFNMWADKVLAKIEHGLNHCNLFLEGMNLNTNCPKENSCPKVKTPCNQGNNINHEIKKRNIEAAIV